MSARLKLGLIGDNIAASQAPRLHRLAGEMAGIEVSYERLVPKELGLSFEGVLAMARASGFDGLNVTYPYKEQVVAHVAVRDPAVRAIGALNTVIFPGGAAQGHNTDYSGFMRAYRLVCGEDAPGVVCVIGAGGVGKAVAFGLLALGAEAIICVDQERAKAVALAEALRATGTPVDVGVSEHVEAAVSGADGIINCTPLGMVNIGGSPLPATAFGGARWVFDAVYTPIRTAFLQDAERAGLRVISGYELFLGQGVDAWALFSGVELECAALRAALSQGGGV